MCRPLQGSPPSCDRRQAFKSLEQTAVQTDWSSESQSLSEEPRSHLEIILRQCGESQPDSRHGHKTFAIQLAANGDAVFELRPSRLIVALPVVTETQVAHDDAEGEAVTDRPQQHCGLVIVDTIG